jgi:hypothetical protein
VQAALAVGCAIRCCPVVRCTIQHMQGLVVTQLSTSRTCCYYELVASGFAGVVNTDAASVVAIRAAPVVCEIFKYLRTLLHLLLFSVSIECALYAMALR